MDLSDLEKLLEPISEEEPCGPDLEYDADFGEMERAAESKPEQQFGDTIVAAEPPDWRDVKKKATALLERTKDMRVVACLARASLHEDGMVGFQHAIELLRGYLETYWDSVHPELDHDDDDDPTYRTNTLITLCDEETILRDLRDAPLVSSRAMGRFSFRDIESAREATEAPTEKADEGGGAWADDDSANSEPEPSGPTIAAVDAAFTDASLEEVQATEAATRLASESLGVIEQFVTEQVGVARAVSLLPTRHLLDEMHKVVLSQLERLGVYDEPEPEEEEHAEVGEDGAAVVGSAGGGGGAAVAIKLNGKIASRKDAIKALDAVCDYYEHNEPSSPLPLLIRRAQRLASKSFLDILRDLAPDAVSQAEALGGGGVGSGSYSDSESESTESDESSSW